VECETMCLLGVFNPLTQVVALLFLVMLVLTWLSDDSTAAGATGLLALFTAVLVGIDLTPHFLQWDLGPLNFAQFGLGLMGIGGLGAAIAMVGGHDRLGTASFIGLLLGTAVTIVSLLAYGLSFLYW
jgi:hypothetical protein